DLPVAPQSLDDGDLHPVPEHAGEVAEGGTLVGPLAAHAPEIGVEHPGRAPGLVGQAHAVLDVRAPAAHEHTPRADAGPRPALARPFLGSHGAVGATRGAPRHRLWSA